ncbi:MAG: PKD domain-containing protein, partial [Anaerolineae bacterium]
TASVTGGEANFTYFWYKNGVLVATHGPTSLTTDTYLATAAGTYRVIVVDNNQCEDSSEPVPVVYVPPPHIVLTKSVDQCEGTATFTATLVSGGEPPLYFAWDTNGDGVYNEFPRQRVITISGYGKSGVVAVRVYDNNNCMDQASTTYAINEELAVEAEIVSLPDCTGEACFTATASGGAAPYTYEWDLDNDGQYDDFTGQSPCRVFPDAGSYTVRVKVTDSSGCTAYDVLSFELHECNGQLEVAFDADIEVCDLNATFFLTVTNTGTCGSFRDIVVTVEAVEGAGYIADILPYVWNVGDLPAGESRSIMVAVSFNSLWDTVPAGTVTRLRAKVTAESCNGPVNIGVEDTVTATRPPEPPDAYEVDNTAAQAAPIGVDGTPQLRSFHEEPDVDWIKFTATAGNEYVITTFDLSRLVDTIIELYGPDMTLLATNDDFGGGKGSRIAWVAETSGTYYVKIRPKYPELCGCENQYKVKVEEFKRQLECPCPDWVVFHSDRDGNWELYRLDVPGGTLTRLTDDPAIDMAPTRSSDAVWIAFQTNRNGLWDIYKVDALGENLTQLTANAGNNLDPMWSTPCGSEYIAFQSDRDGNWEIYIMDGNGNGQMRLTDNAAPDEDPFWSPDGMYITFQSRRNGNWDIYVVDVTGTDLIQLTDDPADDVDPVWSPDGQYIAFRSNRDGAWHTYVMPAAGGEAVKVSAAGNNLNAVWSPDSQWLAYQSDRDGQSEIYAANVITMLETRVTDNAAADEAPTWSCDSQHIVFHTDRDGNWELYMTDILDTGALVRLTDHPRVDAYPMWNPPSEDGSRMGVGRLYRNRVHLPIGH